MKETPPLLIVSRQTLAHLGAAKLALDTLAVASGTTGGISAYSSVLAGTRIALILPIIAAMVSITSLLLRALISYYMGISVIRNPINMSTHQTITQPQPLTTDGSLPTASPA